MSEDDRRRVDQSAAGAPWCTITHEATAAAAAAKADRCFVFVSLKLIPINTIISMSKTGSM